MHAFFHTNRRVRDPPARSGVVVHTGWWASTHDLRDFEPRTTKRFTRAEFPFHARFAGLQGWKYNWLLAEAAAGSARASAREAAHAACIPLHAACRRVGRTRRLQPERARPLQHHALRCRGPGPWPCAVRAIGTVECLLFLVRVKQHRVTYEDKSLHFCVYMYIHSGTKSLPLSRATRQRKWCDTDTFRSRSHLGHLNTPPRVLPRARRSICPRYCGDDGKNTGRAIWSSWSWATCCPPSFHAQVAEGWAET